MSNIGEIRSALDYVDSHDRDLWLKMGAALKDELGEEGFPIWDQWSSSAQNYNNKSTKTTWKSLNAGHIRINTLFYTAIQNGYQPTKPSVPPSAEDMAKRQEEAEQKRLQAEITQREAQEKAKQKAHYIWQEKATPASLAHPYLLAKGITDPECIKGLKQNAYKDSQNLVIPMYQNKEIVSLQFINQDGQKHYLGNGKKDGSYHLIGEAKNMPEGFYMAEGFATAASIHEATSKPVLVTFDAGNLVKVAEKLKPHYPEAQIILAADNDLDNKGMKKATEAAEILGKNASVICPEFTPEQIERYQQKHGEDKRPSDFNDLHALEGLEHLKTIINKETIMENPTKNTEPQAAHQAASFLPEETNQQKNQDVTTNTTSEKDIINSIEPDMKRLLEKAPTPEAENVSSRDAGSQDTQSKEEPEASPTDEPNPKTQQAETPEPTEFTVQKKPLSKDELKEIITDLNYKMPPAGLEKRYLVANGQYLSADNAKTVLFEDKGKKLSTARTDTQIAQDMLDVAKTKGWDAIKLSGSQEFKQTMYVLAESQGIKTLGYYPTEADLKLVDRLREEHSLNGIEEAAKNPAPEKDKNSEQKPFSEKVTERSQPDVEALSKADKMMAASSTPTTGQIETSPKADTDVDVPLDQIGQGSIPSDVMNQAKDLKTHALDTDVLTTAKAAYDRKASKLAKPDQAKLKFFERNTQDAIRGLNGDARDQAMRNFYESMSDKMNGKTLNVPDPLQVPSPRNEPSRTSDLSQDRNQDQEMER